MENNAQLLPVLCLLGPTASGKTDMAIDLINRFPMEIVSVDSAQVYRYMDIGTAKPDTTVLQHAPHALIDIVDPWEAYSVARFLRDANAEIDRIHQNNRIPILAGGTMLYFRSLWDGLSNLPESNPAVRDPLVKVHREQGQQVLYERLQRIDPVSAERIHNNDPQRIIRALEVYEITGERLSSLQNKRAPDRCYDFYNVGLFPQDRAVLHSRIAERFAQMLEQGFEAEVESLMAMPNMNSELPSMRSVGYRQMWQYLQANIDKKQMTEQSVAATRQLAKRQITWLRSMENCRMLDPFVESAMPSNESAMLVDESLDRWIADGLARLTSA